MRRICHGCRRICHGRGPQWYVCLSSVNAARLLQKIGPVFGKPARLLGKTGWVSGKTARFLERIGGENGNNSSLNSHSGLNLRVKQERQRNWGD